MIASDEQPAPAPRPRGRPRDRGRDEDILAAVVRLLAATPYAGLSMSAIARTAGVGKPTLYLRWPSKAAVVADAMALLMSTEPWPDRGAVRADLIEGLQTMERRLQDTVAGRALPGLLADLHGDRELASAFQQRYFAPRRAAIRAVLQRAVDRGEVPAMADVELVIDALVGPVYYRLLVSDPAEDLPAAEHLVDLVLAGVRCAG